MAALDGWTFIFDHTRGNNMDSKKKSKTKTKTKPEKEKAKELEIVLTRTSSVASIVSEGGRSQRSERRSREELHPGGDTGGSSCGGRRVVLSGINTDRETKVLATAWKGHHLPRLPGMRVH